MLHAFQKKATSNCLWSNDQSLHELFSKLYEHWEHAHTKGTFPQIKLIDHEKREIHRAWLISVKYVSFRF